MLLTHGTHYQITERWPVVIRVPLATGLPIASPPLDFLSGNQLLGTLDADRLTIMPGYACDGYSPVFRLCGRWVRLTPVPPAGLWPAVLHDFLRQFQAVPGCPWNRKNTDDWFYDALTAGGTWHRQAGLYHAAVAGPAGTAWIKLTRKTDLHLAIRPL
jgi:hypothetical protein